MILPVVKSEKSILRFFAVTFFVAIFYMIVFTVQAQTLTPEIYESLQFRHIGPKGNRVIAIVSEPGNRDLIYAGAASGGIWKTTDGGLHWVPVFDNQDVSSIGALAMAPSDPHIIWAGTGETNIRSNISIGNGIYKSTNGGKLWQKMGLEKSGRIGRIVIDPRDPDIVLAAVMGHCYGPQQERGVYRTSDGGHTWQRVLFTDENTGASDIAMDPANPRNIIAGMWPLEIKTWQRNSGGPGGGLFISNDSGITWKKLTKGLPPQPTGKIAVAYAPGNPDCLYALIETDQFAFKGVLWGSKDGGEIWNVISYDQQYHTRPHYYSRLAVAPNSENEIWFLATRMAVSLDGGKTSKINSSAGHDVHDIWFDPLDHSRILVAHDGGVRISLNHGKSWYFPDLPVAQMYHVAVDEQIPYFVYGNQQDGPTYRIPSNSIAGGGGHSVGGGETGFTNPDPFDNTIIWSSNEQGVLTKYDLNSGITTNVQVWPETPVGRSPRDIKYRWVWSYPWIVSGHNRHTLYAGSQYVHKTTDGGYTWQQISPDLTTNDTTLQVPSGGLTIDNVGVDYGTTLYAIAESPLNENIIWTGSNDGLVHLTRDGGASWANITKSIPDLPKLGIVTNIEPSHFNERTAYITIDFHQVNNRNPFVFKTNDFGQSWKKITSGIPHSALSYAQIIREDPVRPGMLYCGTENSLYFSLDDGETWFPLRNNLPPAPVRWLTIQEHFNDLVLSTYGRGFWILDDITPLRQLKKSVFASDIFFFKPRSAYRFQRRNLPGESRGNYFEDPKYGASLNYYLKTVPEGEVTITIVDESGATVKTVTGTKIPGINRVYWDLRHESSPKIKLRTPPLGHPGVAFGPESIRYNKEGWRSLHVEGSGDNGPLAIPGTYTITLTVDDREYSETLELRKDPNSEATIDDITEQVTLALNIRDKVTSLTTMGNSIQWIRKQIDDLEELIKVNEGMKSLADTTASLEKKFINLEQNLYILRTTGASENLLRYPQRLFSHLKMLGNYVMTGDARPTKSKYEVFEELSQRLDSYTKKYNELIENNLAQFNRLLNEKGYLNLIAL